MTMFKSIKRFLGIQEGIDYEDAHDIAAARRLICLLVKTHAIQPSFIYELRDRAIEVI